MPIPTSSRYAKFFAPLVFLLITACAETNGSRFSDIEATASQDSSRGRMAAICGGKGIPEFGEISEFGEDLCLMMVDGLAEASASIGKNTPDSLFCVPSSFQPSAFRKSFIEALQRADVSEAEMNRLLGHLLLEELGKRDEEDCDWGGYLTLKEVGNNCRWTAVITTDSAEASQAAWDLVLRSGARNKEAAMRAAGQGLMSCIGYFAGFQVASIAAAEADSKIPYCMAGSDWDFENVTTSRILSAMRSVTKALDEKPEAAEAPAAETVFGIVQKTFPCERVGLTGREADYASLSSREKAARRDAWRQTRLWREQAHAACRDEAAFEASSGPFLAQDFCARFLSGLIEGYAALEGERASTDPCLVGAPDADLLREDLKVRIAGRSYPGKLENDLDRELAQYRAVADSCGWSGKVRAAESARHCLALAGEEGVSPETAVELGQALLQSFAAAGEVKSLEERRSLTRCLAYIRGFLYAVSQLSPPPGKDRICVPEEKAWEGTALLMAQDIGGAEKDDTVKGGTAAVMAAYRSATGRVSCR